MPFLSPLSPILARATRPGTIKTTICTQYQRSFSTSVVRTSGHNKWSKIKHEKAAADKKKTALRGSFAKQLTMYSKLYGADPSLNPQLASVIGSAKKAGMPKAGIDVAIARGQGRSEMGVGLENATLEVMLAPSFAMVVDIESDNKQRSLKQLRTVAKKYGGTVAPTAFMFTRRGCITLGKKGDDTDQIVDESTNTNVEEIVDSDDVVMHALDAGAEDIDSDNEGNLVLWSQPNMTHQVAQELSKTLDMKILNSEILWSCTSEKIKVDDAEEAGQLARLLRGLRDDPDVQAIYINAERGDVSEEAWAAVEEALQEP